jgi:hypothetical protein
MTNTLRKQLSAALQIDETRITEASVTQPRVTVIERGGLFVARVRGGPNRGFGSTAEQAVARALHCHARHDVKRFKTPEIWGKDSEHCLARVSGPWVRDLQRKIFLSRF